jgi:uncharacterized protein DUF4189
MRRISLSVGCLTCALLLAAAPRAALAGFGALAYDESAKKYGLSSNEETQAKADDVATKECGSDKCKIIFRTKPRQCGAIATAEGGEAWGGGVQPQRAAAELDAIKNCQKRSKGQCKVRSVECNR